MSKNWLKGQIGTSENQWFSDLEPKAQEFLEIEEFSTPKWKNYEHSTESFLSLQITDLLLEVGSLSPAQVFLFAYLVTLYPPPRLPAQG